MPLYVTPEDEAREREIADALEKAYRCELVKLGKKGKVDYLAVRGGRVVAVFEIKARQDKSVTFDTLWIETAKVAFLDAAAHFFDVPGFFVARWGDGVIKLIDAGRVDAVSGEPEWVDRTRNPRGDANDRDEVYLCPIDQMRGVK